MCKRFGGTTKLCDPASRENSRLLTLGKSDKNSIFGFSADRTWGDFAVYNLYNSDKNKSADITLDFGDAGLPAGTRCAVYDFWENKVVGYATDSFIGKNIPKNGSLLLRFTPLDRETLQNWSDPTFTYRSVPPRSRKFTRPQNP